MKVEMKEITIRELTKDYSLYHGEAIKTMKTFKANSVDLILVDLPYGTTQNKWDTVIPFEPMWEQFNRIGKENCAMIFTAAQPFASKLLLSNVDNYRYDMIWHKTNGKGWYSVRYAPLRCHEHILVFYRSRPTYNPQMTTGTPYYVQSGSKISPNYGEGTYERTPTVNTGTRYPRSVITIANPQIRKAHPTQKPEELMSYLIRTYSNPGDTVMDCCMGSGTTGISALQESRKFIGIELDQTYFKGCEERMAAYTSEEK